MRIPAGPVRHRPSATGAYGRRWPGPRPGGRWPPVACSCPSRSLSMPRPTLETDRMIQPDPLANATLEEMETFAAGLLPTNALDYYASGARDEQTFRGNLAAWKRWWLVPRMLIDVSTVSTATTILGEPISLPIMIAPMAAQGMAHPDG